MAEPKLDIGDWFQAGVAGVLAVIGAALPWMAGKAKARRDEVNAKLTAHNELLSQHVTQLALIESAQENVAQHLQEIKENMQQSAEKLDQLIMKLVK